MAPDTPVDIEFALDTVTAPLPPLVPAPLITLTAPPTAPFDVAWPAWIQIEPPVLLFPGPTTMLMAPPRPLVADPVKT